MNDKVTRADLHIGILRQIINGKSSHPTTKKLAQFIVDNYNINDEICTLSSLMFICQKIFEGDLPTLGRMNMMTLQNFTPDE